MTFPLKLKLSLFIFVLLILLFGFSTAGFAKKGTAETQSTVRGGTTLFSEDFVGFTGAGFDANPSAGQLDSDVFRVIGLSDGTGTFGGTHDSGDFARGSSTGGETGGGIYAFDVGSGNIVLGVQPTGSDFTPGSFDARITNTSGSAITTLDVSYSIWVLNNAPRANSLNFEWSLDDVTYTPVPALDFTSPGTADGTPAWAATPLSTTLGGFTLNPGESLFLRWSSNDVSGGGARDEFGLDDILVNIGIPPDIVLDKQGPAIGLAGEQLIYSITVGNPSQTDPLDNLILTDTLPSGLAYASDTSGIAPTFPGGNVVEWDFGTLAAGGTISFDLTVNSNTSIIAGTVLTNNLTADAELNLAPVQESTSFDTTFRDLVTIQQIQQVPDPSLDDASPLEGQIVWTEGIVTAAAGEFDGGDSIAIQDSAGGAWSGLIVNGDFSGLTIQRGDTLRVAGEVIEPFGLTRLDGQAFEITGQAALPLPEILATSAFPEQDAALTEQWEGVLVEFQSVEVTEDVGNGEWRFNDGSGIARGDDIGSITFGPAVGDQYDFLRGIGWFSFSNYKVQPRNNDDIEFLPDAFEIFEIQGEDLRSSFAPPDGPNGNDPGQIVRTLDNVVTGVTSNGFFIQMPDDRDSSALPLASRGLFVFTGSAPTVSVGDRVDVTGAVAEFFNFTQIAQPDSIELVSAGNPLPIPIVLDANTPSPDPQALSCGETNFECFEGMRVSVANGVVTAPSQSFGSDPVAEAFINTNGQLVFRGKGAEFPGPVGCPGCPVWSGAPEVFEIDPDRFGILTEPLARDTRFNATGVIGFSFGDYGLWQTELNITSEPALPDPVTDFGVGTFTIGSLNALNLFDDVANPPRPITACGSTDDANDRETLTPTQYTAKLIKLANYIVESLGAPDVVALQEVESLQTLQDLANTIQGIQLAPTYSARLVPGNDRGEINVGYLINEARIAIDSVDQLLADQCLTVDNSPLHDRPPLLLRARFIADGNDLPFAVYNNHLRSLSRIDDDQDGPRVRLKRHEQAQAIAQVVQDLQTAEPDLPIVVIGDINAFEFSDGLADVVGHLRGTAVPSENLVSQENQGQPGFDDSNIPNPPLRLPLENLPALERYSFTFRGVAQTLDHALLDSSAWQLLEALEYARGNADYSESFEFDDSMDGLGFHSSDHDGLVITLNPDRLFSDGFETN